MACLSASSSSSFISSQEWKYDAFLSFMGGDTRNNFTSHLYKELCQKGIITFKDDRELPKGEPFPTELFKAIEDSRILIVVFSKNYATSTWCLDELVKILECKKAGRHTVLPIFYDVIPDEVREQDGEFGEPFIEYERIYKGDIEKVQQWRVASTEIANLSGWDLKDREEAEFIQDIVKSILNQLRRSSQSIAKGFVGMDSRLEKMILHLDMGQSSEVRIIGICGLGGIGKTTVASVVYKEMYCQFEGSSFLTDVRSESSNKFGLLSLQKQLLSATLMEKAIEVYDVYKGTEEIRNRLCRKKVFVVLDDVDQLEQLQFLIGNRDEHWFGDGSRIIITTRDEHLLKQYGVDEIYRVEELNYEEAFQLFCSKALKNSYHSHEYAELSKKVVVYAGGLPLALDILGSSLYGKSLREWNSTFEKLKEIPNEKILNKLQISYDGLDKVSQKVFLDIACFFKGKKKDYVIKVLESCGLFPDSVIRDLIDISLISISYGDVRMHDLVEEMGREIIFRESREEPGQRSRIWRYQDVYDIQMRDMETSQVKAIVLHSWVEEEELLSAKVFSKLKKLRLLILGKLPCYQDMEYLSNELRYLEWYKFPFKSLPPNFQPDKLVELHMQYSSMEQLWKTSMRPIKLLKIIDLSCSENLIRTPDFRGVPNLEELILERCTKLQEVDQSIGVLKRLVSLNLKNCKSLTILPSSINDLKSLKILILRGCSKLEKLPNTLEGMACLEMIDAAGIGTTQSKLSLAKAWNFKLPSWLMPSHPMTKVLHSLSALPFLKKMDLSYCNLPEGVIPDELGCFPSLEVLNLSGNDFVTIPSSINKLSRVAHLEISNCHRLESLPDLPSSIKRLNVSNCSSLENLPNVSEKHNVKKFVVHFSNCYKLNNHQGSINIALAWMKSFLLSFLEIRRLSKIKKSCQSQDEYERICLERGIHPHTLSFLLEFFMYFPGHEIPDWFNYQSKQNPFEIRLPQHSKLSNIAGFVICALFSDVGSPVCEFAIKCKRNHIWSTSYSITMEGARLGTYFVSNHLCLFFVPDERVESSSPTKVLLTHRDIKKCGMRILYEQEIEELIQLNKPLEDLALFQNFHEDSRQEVSSEAESSGDEDSYVERGMAWVVVPVRRRGTSLTLK